MLAAAGAGLVVALGATMLVRVPAGMRAASSRGWLAPGWHLPAPLAALTTGAQLRAPLATLARVAESGELSVPAVEPRPPAGASQTLEARARYRLPPGEAAS